MDARGADARFGLRARDDGRREMHRIRQNVTPDEILLHHLLMDVRRVAARLFVQHADALIHAVEERTGAAGEIGNLREDINIPVQLR